MRQMIHLFLLVLFLAGCGRQTNDSKTGADLQGHTPPTQVTARANEEFRKELDL